MEALKGKTILVLDDEEDLCDLLRDEFEAVGAIVSTCITLTEAQKLIQENSFDGVISDINLPDGDGRSLVASFKQKGKLPNIYFFSGKAEVTSEQAKSLGALGVFPKPYKISSIVEALGNSFLPLEERIRKGRLVVEKNICSVKVQLEGIEQSTEAKLVNIGKSGMFVSLDSTLPYVGQNVIFKIEFYDTKIADRVEGKGICRWVRGQQDITAPRGFGIEFLEFSEDSCSFLEALLEHLGLGNSTAST